MAELSTSERRQGLTAAICCVAIFGITVAVMAPLISLILEGRGYDRTTIGAMAAVPALTLLATNPFIPFVVRKLGLKPFLFLCIAMQLVLVLLMPVFDHLIAWFLLRGLMGAGVNGLFVASETWINAIAQERSRGRVLAIYGTVLSGSFALGPLLVSVAGTAGWLPFLMVAGLIALAALPLLWTRRLTLDFASRASFNVFSFILLAPTLTAVVLLSAFKEMSMGALLPIYGLRSGLDQATAVTLLTAGYLGSLCLQLPIGWVADRMNRYLLLIVLVSIGLMGTLALPFMVAQAPLAAWLFMALWIGLFSGTYIVTMTIVGQRFKGSDLMTANASFGLLWGLGSLSGPLLSGISRRICIEGS